MASRRGNKRLEKTKVLYEKIREQRAQGKGAVQKAKVLAIYVIGGKDIGLVKSASH